MGKPSDKKREKHGKRREDAKQRAKARDLPKDVGGLVRLAASRPFGAAWVSDGYESDPTPPSLVAVVVTRKLPGGLALAGIALVDRTCLGVKNAYVLGPAGEHEIAKRVEEIGVRQGDPMRPCEVLLAQSIVFHAIDYAQELGFRPHTDFPRSLFEPRPPELLPTLGARPERPLFCAGPDDDVRRVLRQLDASVGRGNYEVVQFEDEEHEGDGARRLLATGSGAAFMPVRLYYDVANPQDVVASLQALRCVTRDTADGAWRWLNHEEAADVQTGSRPQPTSHTIQLLAQIRFPTSGTMTVETPSCNHAVAAARFFAPRFGEAAVLTRVRLVNRCFDAREGTPDALAQMLDRDVTIVDPAALRTLEDSMGGLTEEGADGLADVAARIVRHLTPGEEDVPLVEDLPLYAAEETPEFRQLEFLLRSRMIRAVQHWQGNTDVTLNSLISAMFGDVAASLIDGAGESDPPRPA